MGEARQTPTWRQAWHACAHHAGTWHDTCEHMHAISDQCMRAGDRRSCRSSQGEAQ